MDAGLTPKRIRLPGVTRWFGEHLMSQDFLEFETPVKLRAVESDKLELMTLVDWKNARGNVDVLQPFITATRHEEGESYLTLSSMIPILTILHEKTTAYTRNRENNG